MSAPSSHGTHPTATTFNERLNEQLINCLNIQTNVIQNLSQYSQHISLQLFEIKNIVEILSNRVLTLQQQQQQQYSQPSHYGPPQYPASYYPTNYAHPPPTMLPTHPAPSMSHPPIPHSVPFSIPQQYGDTRAPTMTTTAPTSTSLPFFSQPTANLPPQPTVSAAPSFHFSAASTVPPPLAKPTTSAPAQPPATSNTSFFSSLIKPNVPDVTPKPAAPFSTATSEKPSISNPFTFGGGQAAPMFGLPSALAAFPAMVATKTETNAEDDGEGGDDDESYEPNVSFKPIVTLSAVEVKTGEEDENVLFCERAKLYRFDAEANQMKERGVGEMKILQHKTTNVCRILMRREQVLKLCANHQITSQVELKPHQGSENAFVWSAMDYAEGEAKHETLCVRFKTTEQAKKFAKVFNEAKEKNTKKGPSNDNGKAKSNGSDDDVISIGEVKPSAEQVDRAKKLQLPSTFFLYENKDPCKGCAGCEDDSPPTTAAVENKTATKKPTDNGKNETKSSAPTTPSTASAPKTPLSSSENIKFSFLNAEKSQAQPAKPTVAPKEDKPVAESPSSSAQYDSKPSIFGNFNGTAGSSIFGGSTPSNSSSVFGAGATLKPAAGVSAGFTFGGFGNTAAATTPSNGFQFSTPTASTTAASTSSTFSFGTTNAASENKSVFGNTPKFSFAELAKQSSSSSPSSDKATVNGGDQRVFAGQGSLIFGTGATTIANIGNTHDDDDGEGGGDDDSYEPNVSFKPIVTLSAVEVKTGEEDENVLFCERAKLYRFDAEANQMKERGVGEMKILQHKTTNVCRILMRREQVLKLCANHQITSQVELKPHQGSENAFVWSAMDYAEGEAKHETLCVRFKTSELAKKFLAQFNEAKQSTQRS